MTSTAEPLRTLRIPEEVARGIEKRIHGSGFTSVDNFVAFVLARLLEERTDTHQPFSEADEQRLRERLRSLGYID
jgi:Arc/MetJ-type ribon-helix-helix transcriptional regulator